MVNLRAERERMQLSLDEAAARVRIPVRYLDALERGDEDALPAGTFRRGYQRQYLEFLGFDPETEVIPPTGSPSTTSTPTKRTTRSPSPPRWRRCR